MQQQSNNSWNFLFLTQDLALRATTVGWCALITKGGEIKDNNPPIILYLGCKAVRYSTRVSRYTSQACIVYRLGKQNIISCTLSLSLSLSLSLPLSSSKIPCIMYRLVYRDTFGAILYRLVYHDTFAVSTRVSTREDNLDIAQP